MQFTLISAVALLFSGVGAVPVEPRQIDGCPASAPWPMGSPGNYWYPICCPYTLGDADCCNRHPENGITYGGVPIKAC